MDYLTEIGIFNPLTGQGTYSKVQVYVKFIANSRGSDGVKH